MIEKHLNIISFNVPYPADYGGVIDVFYKLKSLSEAGTRIILHTFEYGRKQTQILEELCENVYYYPRKTGFFSQLSYLPYIVYSRKNPDLLQRLLQNEYPILFEGLHTCYYLDRPELKDRLKLVRIHNIEHNYYRGLAKNTSNLALKNYFKFEAQRLYIYQKQLQYADRLLCLSLTEKAYYEKKFGKEKVLYLPLFFQNIERDWEKPEITKPYILYHGDLSNQENIRAAFYLIKDIAPLDKSINWIFAGRNPHNSLIQQGKQQKNIILIANPSSEEMSRLIREAHINLLFTNQVSGVKLKLVHALNEGNFCMANHLMINGSGLDDLCIILPESPEKTSGLICDYLSKNITVEELQKRKTRFETLYNNSNNAKTILNII